MANSFKRDLFELTHGQFMERYGQGSPSLGEFHRLRAMAASGNHDYPIDGQTITLSPDQIFTVIIPVDHIVTRISCRVSASNSGTVLMGLFPNASYSRNWDLTFNDSIELSGIEDSLTHIQFATDSTFTGTLQLAVFGYVPAAS